MTTKEINSYRNERGIFSAGNEAAGWWALSRDGVHMITFFAKNEDRFYKNESSFAKRITGLMKRGY